MLFLQARVIFGSKFSQLPKGFFPIDELMGSNPVRSLKMLLIYPDVMRLKITLNMFMKQRWERINGWKIFETRNKKSFLHCLVVFIFFIYEKMHFYRSTPPLLHFVGSPP